MSKSKVIAVSQRVDVLADGDERRDALDQRWTDFLLTCDITPLLMPNNINAVRESLNNHHVAGVLFTGGNDLVQYGGDAPERDEVETWLLEFAMTGNLPVLGVCRGMQLIQHYFGVKLVPVEGHVIKEQVIRVQGKPYKTNSYHRWGSFTTVEQLEPWAIADDGVIKAVRHRKNMVAGLMWHPERQPTFSVDDIEFVKKFFSQDL
jgi:putative glutamine amidotransferase